MVLWYAHQWGLLCSFFPFVYSRMISIPRNPSVSTNEIVEGVVISSCTFYSLFGVFWPLRSTEVMPTFDIVSNTSGFLSFWTDRTSSLEGKPGSYEVPRGKDSSIWIFGCILDLEYDTEKRGFWNKCGVGSWLFRLFATVYNTFRRYQKPF